MENFKRLQSRLKTVIDEKQGFERRLHDEIQENRMQEFEANTLKGEIHQYKKEKDDLLRYESS